ncbi:MAG: hypothetical protein WCX73_00545 [Candidatus Pacearchaeota archaeon]
MLKAKILIPVNLIIRITLLLLIPISMFSDGIARFIPSSYQVLNLDFSFYTPPLFMILISGWNLFFSSALLEFFWKLTPFLFFILCILLLPKVCCLLKTNSEQRFCISLLFLFSVPSLLYGESILLESLVLFFTLISFILIEDYKNFGRKAYLLIAIVIAMMLYTKQTGYFILAGFFLYICFKKIPKKDKFILMLSLSIGFIASIPWLIKNYLFTGNVLAGATPGAKELIISSLGKLGSINYFELISQVFHYFWMIPLNKVQFSGFYSLAYLGYYWTFLISSIILSILIILGMIKYRKEHKEYLFLMLPLILFSFGWAFFFLIWNDFGRFTFTFHLLFYFFAVKFVSNIKRENIKRLFYFIFIVFVILSVVTAFATTFYIKSKDTQIRIIANNMKENNFGAFSNSAFIENNLGYYSKKKTVSINKNLTKEDLQLEKDVLSLKDYGVFIKNNSYYIFER